jgi:uncharacterized protein (TIGR03437 family)
VDGSGVVRYLASVNEGADTRQATIAVAGQAFPLTQNSGPVLKTNGVLHGATRVAGAVSPGMAVVLTGFGLGPAEKVSYDSVSDGTSVATVLAETRVYFDDVEAPVLYTQAGEVAAMVPYSVDGQVATRGRVEYRGVGSNALDLPVVASQPGLLTVDGTGQGQALAYNADGKENSAANPASRGQVIVLVATGEGETEPAGVDGVIRTAKTAAKPVLGVSATVGGVAAEVVSAGSVDGQVAGIFQVQVVVPRSVAAGAAVAVKVKVGEAESAAGVTIGVR